MDVANLGGQGRMIRCDNISVVFGRAGRETAALEDVAFDVAEGEFVGVTGPSGSGKTTLLNVVAGLLRPRAGSVKVDGEEMYELSDSRRSRLRNRKIGIVFQTYHVHPMLTVRQNVMLPFALSRGESDRARAGKSREEAEDLLRRLGIEELADLRAGPLSSGQKQRVVIARALAVQPEIVLADEPTANLDEANAQRALDVLKRAHDDRGATVLLVAHDPQLIEGVGRTLQLANGRLVS